MTVVYPLAVQIDYTELKFSLRSIEKFLQLPFEVVIVGDHVPEWINNCTQIHLSDIPGQPNYSVRRKVLLALEYADEFLFMNDDIYLLGPDDFKKPYSSGILKGKTEPGIGSILKFFKSTGEDLKYFGHYPAHISKLWFTNAISDFPKDVPVKSAYFNFYKTESIEIIDCKIMTAKKPEVIKEIIKDLPCFSTGAYSIKSALPVLNELFPEPSKYEI